MVADSSWDRETMGRNNRIEVNQRILCSAIVALITPMLGCKSTMYILADGFTGAVNGEPFSEPGSPSVTPSVLQKPSDYPLANAYPSLAESLRLVPLCDCPTPVQRLTHLEDSLAIEPKQLQLYVKQDGVSNSDLYGGNKIRKLELLMAQALHNNETEMLISGSVGSNSVVATALVAKHLGIVPEIHLVPQMPSQRVTTNLLVLSRILQLPLGDETQSGSEVVGSIRYHESSKKAYGAVLSKALHAAVSSSDMPFVCPPGATSPLTTIAYVNAMYELAQDVEDGRLPSVPSRIYVPTGSGGTFIGLLIGARTIPLFRNTDIIPVTSGSNRPTEQYHNHLEEVSAYLAELTNGTFNPPEITLHELDAMLDRDSSGTYGEITPKGLEAQALAAADNLHLEHTYTAKTVARLIHDARQAGHPASSSPEIWLYWHTHNATGRVYTKLADPAIQPQDLIILERSFTHPELLTYGLRP